MKAIAKKNEVLLALLAAMFFMLLLPNVAFARENAPTTITAPETAITYTDPQTGIVFYAEANTDGDGEEDGTATLRLIVLDALDDNSNVTELIIPSSISSGEKSYAITAITPSGDWGYLSSLASGRAGSNTNIFGEEISYDTKPARGEDLTPTDRLAQLRTIRIPITVKEIGYSAFRGSLHVATVDFGEDSALISIDKGAFWMCEDLASIELPSGLTTFGNRNAVGAFARCYSLESITIPAKVESIPGNTFSECTSLKTILFGEGSALTQIELDAFFKCTSLESIVIPEGVTYLSGFRNCTSLTSIDVSACQNLLSIGRQAFNGCSSLTSFEIPNTVTGIGQTAFGATGIVELYVPDSVISVTPDDGWIASGALLASSKTKRVSLPASLFVNSDIAKNLLNSSSNLEQVTIRVSDRGLDEICFAQQTFANCSNLQRIVIDGDVKSIVTPAIEDNPRVPGFNYPFYNDSSLMSIIIAGRVATVDINLSDHFSGCSDVVFFAYDDEYDVSVDENAALPTWCHDNGFTYKTLSSLDAVVASLDEEPVYYTGEAKEPVVTVKDGEDVLVAGTDYKVSYSDNLEVGTATVQIVGLDTYGVYEQTLEFEILENDKSELVAAIEAAQADLDATLVGEQEDATLKWVEQEDADTFAAAIEAAQAIVDDPNQTEGDIASAVDALQLAQFHFDAAKQGGESIDYAPLFAAVKAAQDDVDAAIVSEDGSDVDAADQWVTQDAVDALEAAIAEAVSAASTAASQGDVAAAIGELEAAQAAFDASKASGGIPEPTPIVPAASATRLYGNVALDTMAAIVQSGFDSCDAVVISSVDGYWDALAASSLAGQLGCPVLMTDPASLSTQAASEIERLGASKVYIAGGTAAVSASVESQLAAKGLSVERLAGDNAQDTAVKIAGALGTDHGSTCVIATSNGYWDALSASPYAYAQVAPVFLTDGDGVLSAGTLAAIKAGGYTGAVIAGGTAVVSSSTEDALAGVGVTSIKRCGGADAYETAILLAQWELSQGMGVSNVGVATSANGYWDALSGAALCGVNNSVIILADEGHTFAVDQIIAPNASSIEAANVFGGTAAIAQSVEDAINAALVGNAGLTAQAASGLVAGAMAA